MSLNRIFFILIIFNFSSVFSLRCGADLLMKKLNIKTNLTSGGIKRRKLSDQYTNINIKIDYRFLDYQKASNSLSDYNYNLFKIELDETAKYFKKIISVQREYFDLDSLLSAIKDQCELEITNLGEINTYDLIVFPEVDIEERLVESGIIASATHCVISGSSSRPIVGRILLGKELNSKSDIKYYIRNALFHEFFHILGYNTNFFIQKYEENSYTYLNSPKLLEKAKIHFGCENIKGLRLEDQGGQGTAGSHWDARYMQGDLMIGEDYSEVVLSDMTLAFLEDFGFYKVNYYTGGLFRFGKNQGCSFLQNKCVYDGGRTTFFSNEFCTEYMKPFCTGSHTSKGSCYTFKYKQDIDEKYRYYSDSKAGGKMLADYCPISFYNDVDDNYNYPMNCVHGKKEYNDEIIGSNSMCFESSVNLDKKVSICYDMECDRENKRIKVNIGTNTIFCGGKKSDLTNPEGLMGTLSCPDYNMVCTSDTWCNDIYDCIDKESKADSNTYDFISDKEELQKRDRANLEEMQKKDRENSGLDNSFYIKYEWIYLFILSILILN